MRNGTSEDFRGYFNRIRPIYHRLFNLAHAVTGSRDQAEYCLQCAMLECRGLGDGSASSHGFRESLRSAVVSAAQKIAASDAPEAFDWVGLPPNNGNPIAARINREPAETQRILALKYGCGLPARKIARLCRADARYIRNVLDRFEARVRRELPSSARVNLSARITRAVNAALDLPASGTPELSVVIRAFLADASTLPPPRRGILRILRIILVALLAVSCIVYFWFAAVLLQPAVLEDGTPAAAAQTQDSAREE